MEVVIHGIRLLTDDERSKLLDGLQELSGREIDTDGQGLLVARQSPVDFTLYTQRFHPLKKLSLSNKCFGHSCVQPVIVSGIGLLHCLDFCCWRRIVIQD